MSNSFGTLFRITDFGESHGAAVGGVIDGCPAGLEIDLDFVNEELRRRAPSHDELSTERHEPDSVKFLSGIRDSKTLGTPIAFLVMNRDVKADSANNQVIKPSHASFVYMEKYEHEDNYGSGRASARQTVCRVVAGAIAKLLLKRHGIKITSALAAPLRPCPPDDTIGAKVRVSVSGVPAGLGEPVYDKLDARLAYAMLSINAAKGFELGAGFHAADMLGSEYNDRQTSGFEFLSNNDGGVQAGISNGQEIFFTVAFKPIPTLRRPQQTIDFNGQPAVYEGNSRNDRCVCPRVLPVVEAMTALVLADFLLQRNANQI